MNSIQTPQYWTNQSIQFILLWLGWLFVLTNHSVCYKHWVGITVWYLAVEPLFIENQPKYK